MIDEIDNIDKNINNFIEHCRSLSIDRSPSLIVFRNLFERFYQQCENTSSNRSSNVGDNQDKR